MNTLAGGSMHLPRGAISVQSPRPSSGMPWQFQRTPVSNPISNVMSYAQNYKPSAGPLLHQFPGVRISSPRSAAVSWCPPASTPTTPYSLHEPPACDKEFIFAPARSGGMPIEQLVIKSELPSNLALSRSRCLSPSMKTSGIISSMVSPHIPEIASPVTWASGSVATVVPTEDTAEGWCPREDENGDDANAAELEKPTTRRRISILATPRRRQARAPATRKIRTPDDISGTFLAATVDTFFASGLRNAAMDLNAKPKKLIQAPPASGMDNVKFGGKLPSKERRLTIPSSSEEVNDFAYIYQQVGPTGVTPRERGARTLGRAHV